MHALTFWKRAVQPRTGDDEPTRSSLAGRRARRRSLIALSLGGAVVAATAIAFGLPTAGMAVYIAATLPFALF